MAQTPDQHAGLEVIGLSKDYTSDRKRNRVVRDVSFRIEAGHFYSLLGPSGCGKTTTLRCVAGLEYSDAGEIRLGGSVLSSGAQHLPPDKRNLGMVFQNYAIWPHMTVFENTAFPLRVGQEKIGKTEIRRRVEEALAVVRLSELSHRPAVAMSGGQQQRLAVARALVRRPRLLLLDEPLSNLDAKLRDTMRAELRDLQRRLGITTLYVTHDQAEALSMSDRVAVMKDGELIQEGTPREIYHQPASRFVADFVGRANIITGTIAERLPDGDVHIQALGGVVRASCPGARSVGDEVTISLRPEEIRHHTVRPAGPNVAVGRVTAVEFLGEIHEYTVQVADTVISVRQNPGTPLHVGDEVFLELAPHSCTVLP